MRLSLLSLATSVGLLADTLVVQGFSVHQQSSSGRACLWRLSADASSESPPEITRTKPMSPEEIKARMREKEGLPDEDEEPPKLYSESLYEDMRQTLLALENRIKNGPGSLSMLEVEQVCAQTGRILVEMREFEAGRVSGLGSAGASTVALVAPAVPTGMATSQTVYDETNDEEGEAYAGKGGLGLAKGTVNTYVIDGMDEMSPEEYQKALQQSIIDRQSNRKTSGGYGNRATWDYLNNLTGAGDNGVLKKMSEGEAYP